MRRELFGDYAFLGHYRRHPDRNQENFFFGLLRECIDNGSVTEAARHAGMSRRNLYDKIEKLGIPLDTIKDAT